MAQTDLFRKAKSLFSTTLSSGIASGTGDTITLASVTGLPTDTEITLTFDRVDGNGDSLGSLVERITGTISGSTLSSYTRGIDGTSDQAHSSGAVIEYIWNADDWNDMVDGIIAEHSQAGAHTDATTSAKGVVELATTAETTTGTDTDRAVTPDGLHDMTSLSGAAWLEDEDDMSSDSATTVPSQQSVKAYVDSGTTTMTNKRITRRVSTEASSATPTINTDNVDAHSITALATNITSMTTNLSGTPTNFQPLVIRILDNGTARTITWGASFQAMGVDLPTTTTISKVLTVGFLYDTVDSKWGCVASIEEG